MSLPVARELAVLSIVIAHPVHGYQIASAFEKGPLQLLGLKRSAVYTILSRFVKRGWIDEKEEPGGAYPDRQVCHPTQAGRVALNEMVANAGGLPQTPLMSLMMLLDAGVDVHEALKSQHAFRQSLLRKLNTSDDDHRHTMSVQLAVNVLAAEIEVIEKALN